MKIKTKYSEGGVGDPDKGSWVLKSRSRAEVFQTLGINSCIGHLLEIVELRLEP